MFDRFSLSQKFGLISVAGCLALGLALGVSASLQSDGAARLATEERLTAIALDREHALTDYIAQINDDLATTATNPNTIAALSEFTEGWQAMGRSPGETLQRLYITDNPHPTGAKENLDRAPDTSRYSAIHARYHPWFRQFLRARGYYDIFLFDTEGNLVYTVFKELDYATNLNNGEYRDTDLGRAFRNAVAGADGETHFFDFRAYSPSHGAPASFMATPVNDENGRRIGVLAFQMPIDRLNNVMGAETGLLETGDAYAFGSDGLLRTAPRFGSSADILNRAVPTAFLEAASGDTHSFQRIRDYRGDDAFVLFNPADIAGVHWNLVVTQTTDEALASSRT
ncbi:MAG: cache domain-containing protein, partial [Proteobacteria bacterium]|nr:cache domain-containing protein [Pseudomonadota bacterium]